VQQCIRNAETAAGSVILICAANMLGPMAFATFVAITKRVDVASIISGATAVICLPLL
jgi:hypothetical protein